MSTTVNGLPRLLSVDELASYLRVPKATLYSWRTRGGGPPGMKVGRHVRYRLDEVAEWVAGRDCSLSEPDGVAAVADVSARGGVVGARAGLVPRTSRFQARDVAKDSRKDSRMARCHFDGVATSSNLRRREAAGGTDGL